MIKEETFSCVFCGSDQLFKTEEEDIVKCNNCSNLNIYSDLKTLKANEVLNSTVSELEVLLKKIKFKN
jgi:transcription elongation factor Elf1